MTNKPKRRYRIRNWRDYNSALVRRGSLTLWVVQSAVGRRRDTAAPARRGRRRLYSDLAITCALTLREVYGLPLHLAVGSTGPELYGEGEWKVRLHGKEERRTWRKLRPPPDHTTRECVALALTDKDVLGRRELSGLLGAV